MAERRVVALVRGLRGLDGTVRVEVLTDQPEDRFAVGAVLYPEGAAERLTVRSATPVADGRGWWLRFRERADRSSVEPLRDVYLETDVAAEPRTQGEYLWDEVIGLAVRGDDGRDLGSVVDVYRAGGAEVYVVRGPAGELDVPAVRSIVRDLAPERGEVVVDTVALGLAPRATD